MGSHPLHQDWPSPSILDRCRIQYYYRSELSAQSSTGKTCQTRNRIWGKVNPKRSMDSFSPNSTDSPDRGPPATEIQSWLDRSLENPGRLLDPKALDTTSVPAV
jgi:hypothetical protein